MQILVISRCGLAEDGLEIENARAALFFGPCLRRRLGLGPAIHCTNFIKVCLSC